MFIIAVPYISYRINNFPLNKKNIKELCKLFESLFYTKKYDDLTFLLENYMNNIVKINSSSQKNKIASKLYGIYAPPWQNMVEIASFAKKTLDPKTATKQNCIKEIINKLCTAIANFLQHEEPHHDLIANLFNRLLTSEEYVKYLAATKPYFCLELISNKLNSNFLKLFITALIRDKHSIYYYELNNSFNSANTTGKLLNYFFNNIKTSEKEIDKDQTIYRLVGEEVIYQLEKNQQLITKYNQKLERDVDTEENKCPIYISLQFFKLLIENYVSQEIKVSLYVSDYFTWFVKKIIVQIPDNENKDNEKYNHHSLYATTYFHELINEIISLLKNFLSKDYTKNENTLVINDDTIKNIFSELGQILFEIIQQDKIAENFKISIVDKIIWLIRDNQNKESIINTETIDIILNKGTINKNDDLHYKQDDNYLKEFKKLYRETGHAIIFEIKKEDFQLDKQIDKLLQVKAKI